MKRNEKLMWLILSLVAFLSGVIVAFEWMGHDDGSRVYSMLKRDTVEKEVIREVYKPVVVTDDVILELMLQEYRDALIKIADSQDEWSIVGDAEEEIKRMQQIALQAMSSAKNIVKGD